MTEVRCHRHVWTYRLTLVSPIAFAGNENVLHGIDQALLRNHLGEIVLSGAQIRGNLRHFLLSVRRAEDKAERPQDARLVKDDLFKLWFGDEGVQDFGANLGGDAILLEAGTRSAGRLTIRDAVIQGATAAHELSRIKIDRNTGSVASGSYLVSEQPGKTGSEWSFEGKIVLYGSAEEAAVFSRAFVLFSELLSEIGGMKSSGYGRIVEGSFVLDGLQSMPLTLANPAAGSNDPSAVRTYLRISFDEPLLVEPRIRSGNVQMSSSIISGGTIKAAIAEFGRMARPDFDREFGEALSAITVRSAMPTSARGYDRPRRMPLSLATERRETSGGETIETFIDLLSGAEVDRRHLRYAHDFKSGHDERIGRSYFREQQAVSWVSRTRTAIALDSHHADEGRLFSYQMVNPRDTAWLAEIYHPEGNAEINAKAGCLVEFLQSGMIQIGKTRADMKISETTSAMPRYAVPIKAGSKRIWKIVLCTPSALLSEADIAALPPDRNALELYRTVIQKAVDERARSVGGSSVSHWLRWDEFDCMVRHHFEGGHRAKRARDAAGMMYYPFVMTSAGSVFFIPEIDDLDQHQRAELTRTMQALVDRGLPSFDGNWRTNPFTPENGYGEVCIDDEDRIIVGDLEPLREL